MRNRRQELHGELTTSDFKRAYENVVRKNTKPRMELKNC